MSKEQTLIILKPDCMEKGLHGECISRFARAGLEVVACKLTRLDKALLAEHYAHIAELPFYPGLEAFMMARPVMILIVEGENAIARIRKLIGPTDSVEAAAGTIRGDMGIDKGINVVHASDGPDTAAAEIKRFFKPEEIFDPSDYQSVLG